MVAVTGAAVVTPTVAQQRRAGTVEEVMRAAEVSLASAQTSMFAAQQSLVTLEPTIAWFPQDTADAMYRRARAAFSARNYQQAVELFRQVRQQFAQSQYLAQAMYYEAFALSRLDSEEYYNEALNLLEEYRSQFADNWESEHASLYTRIPGQLARLGDPEAAAAVAERAAQLEAQRDRVRRGERFDPRNFSGVRGMRQGDEDDVRMQALNALMQMDAESAMPILRDVLANKDTSRVKLRRRALMIVAQKRVEGREDILIDAARNDPDLGVREQAVQWLSMVRTDRAVAALDSILQSATEESLQRRALMALSQHNSEAAGDILMRFAQRSDISMELRKSAIQWLGHRRDAAQFLRDYYQGLDDVELKEQILMGLSQGGRHDEEGANAAFLLGIAQDESEDMKLRGRALFWLGHMQGLDQDIYAMYDQVSEAELKNQLISVYGQRGRRDSLAVDRLIEIVRNETDQALQSQAIFWLGQTGDARAAGILREIINRD
jgi:HEAT repeat protein